MRASLLVRLAALIALHNAACSPQGAITANERTRANPAVETPPPVVPPVVAPTRATPREGVSIVSATGATFDVTAEPATFPPTTVDGLTLVPLNDPVTLTFAPMTTADLVALLKLTGAAPAIDAVYLVQIVADGVVRLVRSGADVKIENGEAHVTLPAGHTSLRVTVFALPQALVDAVRAALLETAAPQQPAPQQPAPQLPALLSLPAATLAPIIGAAYESEALAASDVTLTAMPALPAGLSFASGRLVGTPSALSATTSYAITATAISGRTEMGTLSLRVLDHAPAIAFEVDQFTFVAARAIADAAPVASSRFKQASIAPALPQGLTLDTATGVLSGTPQAVAGAQDHVVTVTNADGASATVTLRIAVVAAAIRPGPVEPVTETFPASDSNLADLAIASDGTRHMLFTTSDGTSQRPFALSRARDAASWTAKTTLYPTPAAVTGSIMRVFASPLGGVYAVTKQGNDLVFSARAANGTWPAGTVIRQGTGLSIFSGSVRMHFSPNGREMLAWHEAGGPDGASLMVALRANAASAWTVTRMPTTGVFSDSGSGLDSDGRAYAAWSEATTIKVRRNTPLGGWEAEETAGTGSWGMIGVAPSGVVTAAWLTLVGGNWSAHARQRAVSGAWEPSATTLGTGVGAAQGVQVFARKDGTPHVSWRYFPGGGHQPIAVSERRAGAWSATSIFNDGVVQPSFHAFCELGDGRLVGVFGENSNGNPLFYHYRVETAPGQLGAINRIGDMTTRVDTIARLSSLACDADRATVLIVNPAATDANVAAITTVTLLERDETPVAGSAGALTGGAQGPGKIALTWAAAKARGAASSELRYAVYVSPVAGGQPLTTYEDVMRHGRLERGFTAGTTAVTLDGLEPDADLHVNVVVADPKGQIEVYASGVFRVGDDTTAPTPQGTLTITTQNGFCSSNADVRVNLATDDGALPHQVIYNLWVSTTTGLTTVSGVRALGAPTRAFDSLYHPDATSIEWNGDDILDSYQGLDVSIYVIVEDLAGNAALYPPLSGTVNGPGC